MKQIEPIQIWKNGGTKTAEFLDARIINDDLKSSCTFYWQLTEANVQANEESTIASGAVLSEGNSYMSGEDYLNWDGSNDSAYEFVANQINVTILA